MKMLNLDDIKCGEIYYSNDSFIYHCIFCDKKINDIQQFRSHYIQSHKEINVKSKFSPHKLLDNYCESKLDFQKPVEHVNKIFDELQRPQPKETDIKNSKDDKKIINFPSEEINELNKIKLDELSILSTSEEYDNFHSNSHEETETVCEKDYKTNNTNVDTDNKKPTEIECVRTKSKTNSKSKGKNEKCKEFPCEICGRIYQRPKKLKSHMETHTPDYLTCNICKQILNNRRNLIIHIKLHNGETFNCTFCEAKFSRKSNLKQHILRIHKKERPFACKYENCNSRFINNSLLRAHELTHTGTKPHVCEFCGRSFINISALTEHIKRHTNQRDFKCSHCDKKFFDKKLLKDHEIGHTGIKNFVCTICSVYFLRKKSLACHMKKHSDIKNYKCKICTDSFSLYNDLAYHIKKKHNVTKLNKT